MKRLDEMLSKMRNAATSEAPSGTSPATADDPDDAGACPICRGAGFVRRPYPVDHPRFGRAEPCDCVLREREDQRRERLTRLSNIGALARFTFATLDPAGRGGSDPAFAEAVAAARAYAEDPRGWLVLTGPSGSGKTHLAAALANRRIELGHPVLFMVVADLLDHLRAGYDADDEDLAFDRVFDQVRNAPLLILDDLDGASGTSWAREKLLQVLNHRFNLALPTVITLAAPPASLDPRLATRLLDPALARVVALGRAGDAAYREVGGMSRERLAAFQFSAFETRIPGLREEERLSLEAALEAARRYADDPQGWLVLVGPNGCGKTHLAGAIANRALERGRSVFFAVVPDLLDHLRASYMPGRELPYDELFDRVRTADLLILDDFGAQAATPWAQEKLYQVVNYRHVSGLPTVVTSDRSLEELQAANPRIVARIADPRAGAVLAIIAPHYHLGRGAAAPPGPRPPRRTR
ncbi:ATP-binding protein [Tepidiforma sp.]|jgi:DNA replication protein DnaC|uniref:ATP-binding protein n=1 Tax=Tepidiforma sp. TaxID=2682230 RepID=UPI00262EA76F|nr:ATP-binding protein [Tepidiforma sp.]MCX7616676.1 ATP-binding protein [Tepidiforma sp.]